MPNSSLAAMYNQCDLCANTTIIAFQDENGFIQIGNLTSNRWTLGQMGAALDPGMGTGLALQPFYLRGAGGSDQPLSPEVRAQQKSGKLGTSLEEQRWFVHGSSSSILLMLKTQSMAGHLTHKSTTRSQPAHLSPLLPLIPTSPLATKLGSKSYPSPTEGSRSILGLEQEMTGWNNMRILR